MIKYFFFVRTDFFHLPGLLGSDLIVFWESIMVFCFPELGRDRASFLSAVWGEN